MHVGADLVLWGVEQRWLLVYSEQAYQREQASFEKKLIQQHAQLDKHLWHLKNETFACVADARKARTALAKRYRYFSLGLVEVHAIKRYTDKGRPRLGAQKVVVGYRLTGEARRDKAAIEGALTTKGRFILATNDLNTEVYPDAQLLADYKDQQGVERGFRFLKDPWFMVDSIFLKSPKRIEALMMVMTLCLLVYNLAQYRLRQRLKDEKETLPNQLNKPVQNPTLRWIFQLMEG